MSSLTIAARTAASARTLISRADKNHDGKISRAELRTALGHASGAPRQVANRAVLSSRTAAGARGLISGALAQVARADRNHDGFISGAESRHLNQFQKMLLPNGGSAPGHAAPTRRGAGHQIGGYGPLHPPAELLHYGNGRIPANKLTPIGINGHRLYGPAAAAFGRMRAAAAHAGVNIGVTDSYRSYAQQVELAHRKGLYANGGLAATPGKSNHGWGLALDLNVKANGMAWLRQNGGRFGFAEAVPREPWHWEYRPNQTHG